MKYFFILTLAVLFIIIVIGQKDPEFEPIIRECHIIIISILLEAIPFILIGSLVSGIIEVFVSRDYITRLIPKNRFAAAGLASLLGLVFPVCECGIIPVVRRLTKKGFPVFFAVTYMLAAPIINPVVIASTIVAYKGSPDIWFITGGRIGGGIVISITIGLVCSLFFKDDSVIKHESSHNHCNEDHSCGCLYHQDQPVSFAQKIRMVFMHAGDDFFDIGPFLILGAFIAGILRAISIPVNGEYIKLMDLIMGGGSFQIYAMMALALVLSLCSEADAFFSRAFPVIPAARLAFLVTGPMLDLKLFIMYFKLFRKRLIIFLVLSICILNAIAWQVLHHIMKAIAHGG